jgi:hypothetical protein
MNKPVLGVIPHKIWREKAIQRRLDDLLAADMRYQLARQTTPHKLVIEYYKLYHNLHKTKVKKEFHVHSH